jgi:chemotaxis protein MotB
LGSAGLVGCAAKDDVIALQHDRDNLAEQLAAAQRRADSQAALAAGYSSQLDRIQNSENAEQAMIQNLNAQLAAVTSERDAMAARYEDLVGKIGTGPALPEPLTSELSIFAAEYPDLIAFDADQGIVKFKSDVTFNSGDATLQGSAATAIDRFAQILNSPVARAYELRVAGHTDNVSNFSAVTKQKGHKNNWYLSSHRAISVAERLMSQGIASDRIGVLGFADQRPAASNETAAGKAQNRRVEVLILPSTVSADLASGSADESAMPASSTVEDDSGVMK